MQTLLHAQTWQQRCRIVDPPRGEFAAWAQLQPLLVDARLRDYAPLQVVRGELLQQLGREQDARDAFASAAALSQNQAERTLLRQRAGLPPEN